MSTIQAKNAALLRERRYENALGEAYDPTADEAKPNERDRWAVHTLLKAGQIERQHKDAAEWLWGLIEKGQSLVGGAWIDDAHSCGGGGWSPVTFDSKHQRAMKVADARRAAESAFHAVSLQGYGRFARTLFDSLPGHGRPTVAQCAERLGMETNGCRRRLAEMLEALSDYRDRVDADRAAYKARVTGIDPAHLAL